MKGQGKREKNGTIGGPFPGSSGIIFLFFLLVLRMVSLWAGLREKGENRKKKEDCHAMTDGAPFPGSLASKVCVLGIFTVHASCIV